MNAHIRPLAAIVFASCAFGQEVPLEAGLAKVDITPSASLSMAGYSGRKCTAKGTHDPLQARAIVLRTGDTKLAIVTADVISLVSANLHKRAAENLGIRCLLLAASHTHSGPAFSSFGSVPAQPTPEVAAYISELENKVYGAIEQASRSMFPARLSTGRGSIQLGYNRLRPQDDGRSRALFDNLDRVPYGPVDPEFMLLRVEDQSGTPRALIVHYAAHAVTLGQTNCLYSADYPGVMKALTEAEFPGLQCMFVQGATGDINPSFQGRAGNDEADFAVTRKMGELLAREVIRAAKRLPYGRTNLQPIQFKSEILKFSERWEKDRPVDVGITTVLINREIAIAAVPGEPFLKLQTLWKEQAEVPFPLFYGYTDSTGAGWPGYIPDVRSAAHGGYGADNSTRIEPGAAERIVLKHLIHLYEMQGMWLDKPGRP